VTLGSCTLPLTNPVPDDASTPAQWGDAVIASLGADGVPRWARAFGVASSGGAWGASGASVATNAVGDVVAAFSFGELDCPTSGCYTSLPDGGTLFSTVNAGGVDLPSGLVVAAYARDGAHLWSEAFTWTYTHGFGSRPGPGPLALFPDGTVALSGTVVGARLFLGSSVVSGPPYDIQWPLQNAFVAHLR
jgi:hypothetical protein